ncbi:MAG: multidrug efflux SMR transporter [Sporolactobacillus sp.]
MSWLFLAGAILFEVSGTLLMKASAGLSHTWISVAMFGCYLVSLAMLSQALKTIEVGTAYAIWSGIGIVLIVSVGALVFKESVSVLKAVFIAFILIGAIGLNLMHAH